MSEVIIEQPPEAVLIDYTNHAGVRQVRTIWPRALKFGASQGHPERQWLLDATDMGKIAERTFAMASINRWGVHPDKQMSVDLSIARQLQQSMERNARMANRLKHLVECFEGKHPPLTATATEKALRAVLADEEPTWDPL